MIFYNPKTKEFLDKKKLALKYNTSIPSDTEEFEGWHKVHYEDYPTVNEFQRVEENKIRLIDGVYIITYSIVDDNLDGVKEIKKSRLSNSFDEVYDSKHLKLSSSLGFEINANSVANTNIDGLIKVLKKTGVESVLFRAFNNDLHNVTLDDLETMQMEIIMNGQALYAKKWELETIIDNCSSLDELIEIEDDFSRVIM
jgi:hypothetical protein